MKKIKLYEGYLTTFYETGMEYLGYGITLNNSKIENPYEKLILLKKNDTIEIELPNGELRTYTINNLSLAKKDNYHSGDAYPIECGLNMESFLEFKIFFNSNSIKGKIYRTINKIAYYGGTFDPFHDGHLKIIKELHYFYDEVIVVPTNNYLKSNFMFNLEKRIQACEEVCSQFNNVVVLNLQGEDTSKTFNVIKKLEFLYSVKPDIVIGGDNLDNLPSWYNFNELNNYHFIIIPRGPVSTKHLDVLNSYELYKKILDVPISSTDIKKHHDFNKVPAVCRKIYGIN